MKLVDYPEGLIPAVYYTLADAIPQMKEWGVTSIKKAEALIVEGDYLEAWFNAERQWLECCRRWLQAEKAFLKAQEREREYLDVLNSEAYVLASRGWQKLKTQIPNLDGVQFFSDLPKSLQYRYALIAAEGANLEHPKEVRSKKQVLAEGSEFVERQGWEPLCDCC